MAIKKAITKTVAPATKTAVKTPAKKAVDVRALILEALADGPMSKVELVEATGFDALALKPYLGEMMADEEVEINSGVFSIVGAEPEKEAEPEAAEEVEPDLLFMVSVYNDETEEYDVVACDRDEKAMTKEYNKLAKKGEDATLSSAIVTDEDDDGGYETAEGSEVHILPEVETPEDDEADEDIEPEEQPEGLEGEDDELTEEYETLADKKKLSKTEQSRFDELDAELTRRGLFESDEEPEQEPEFEPIETEEEEVVVSAPKAGKKGAAVPAKADASAINKYVPMNKLSDKDLKARIDEADEAIELLLTNGLKLSAEMLVRAVAKARTEMSDKQ